MKTNKVAFVLGASGNIGRSTVMHLAKAGYDIALHDNGKNSKDMDLLQTFLKNKYKSQRFETYIMNFDSGEFDSKKLIRDVLKDNTQIDVMINCVGDNGETSFMNVQEEEVRHIMQINLIAPFLITQRVFNHMIENKNGCIVNLSSFVVNKGCDKSIIHYSMSKAAIENMTHEIGKIGGPLGVRCNCISPGKLDNDVNSLGRPVTPSEVAEGIMFCITNQHLNGEIININGG